MNKKCVCCGNDYPVENSDAFHRFRFCTEACETQFEEQMKTKQGDMHICCVPLPVKIFSTNETFMVETGTKWQRNDSQLKGLSAAHLQNISGIAGGLEWIEISQEVLELHFQKIN